MAAVFVKPKPDLKVLDPVTLKPLPAEGAEVDGLDPYWFRRVQDGDVVAVDPKADKKEAK